MIILVEWPEIIKEKPRKTKIKNKNKKQNKEEQEAKQEADNAVTEVAKEQANQTVEFWKLVEKEGLTKDDFFQIPGKQVTAQ